ncbi:hypothetical protein CEXT_118621 [Caerostris extrusa]|uniref:Uncharacterized protein n=1 Tax=Caerostris extrusa TaxID=172846 RepID=A0AAV4RUU7_CAEEX|nr:hypothetical protein CEXT_118621 [Caerostris extrusa]
MKFSTAKTNPALQTAQQGNSETPQGHKREVEKLNKRRQNPRRERLLNKSIALCFIYRVREQRRNSPWVKTNPCPSTVQQGNPRTFHRWP